MTRQPDTFSTLLCRIALFGVLTASIASAATIEGRVIDKDGLGLEKVRMCMANPAEPRVCVKTTMADRYGYYSFNGVKEGAYQVGVDRDRSAAGRRADAYKTFVWTASVRADVRTSKDCVDIGDTVGKFNFSNFQRSLELKAADFPEIGTFDPRAEPVFIKVYHAAVDPSEESQTVFIGRVGNLDKMSIEASIPLAARELAYDIYSASSAASGVIAVGN